MSVNQYVLTNFNSYVVDSEKKIGSINLDMVHDGIITDFPLNFEFRIAVREAFPPLKVSTLFSKNERLNASFEQLIHKQIAHYIEVNVLNSPGLFSLEVEQEEEIFTFRFVKGITVDQLAEKVLKLIYANAPVKNAQEIVAIIRHFGIKYDFKQVKNNEIRIMLYNHNTDTFETGDDVVRYMVYNATGNTLVIKDKKTIAAIKAASIPSVLFTKHAIVLSEVFNRFKPLILAAKTSSNRHAINKISRLSKHNHKRVYESVSKSALNVLIKAKDSDRKNTFNRIKGSITMRDAYKLLNLIEYKKLQHTVDAFVIRNGTVHVEQRRPILKVDVLMEIEALLIGHIRDTLAPLLKGKKILLDSKVDYGLPISRKQTVGKLPYGTEITVGAKEISSGIYWENSWGARDLDLSAVDLNGNRTGWGRMSGYSSNDIIFSGDLVDATNGAMEFMTSKNQDYALFVNIFSGSPTAQFEMVVGSSNDKHWMNDVVVREKSTLMGKGSIVGFVKGNKFVVFQGKLNDRIANFGEANPTMKRAAAPMWTVSQLLAAIGIAYDTESNEGNYDFDLTYANFSLDKLEEIL